MATWLLLLLDILIIGGIVVLAVGPRRCLAYIRQYIHFSR